MTRIEKFQKLVLMLEKNTSINISKSSFSWDVKTSQEIIKSMKNNISMLKNTIEILETLLNLGFVHIKYSGGEYPRNREGVHCSVHIQTLCTDISVHTRIREEAVIGLINIGTSESIDSEELEQKQCQAWQTMPDMEKIKLLLSLQQQYLENQEKHNQFLQEEID